MGEVVIHVLPSFKTMKVQLVADSKTDALQPNEQKKQGFAKLKQKTKVKLRIIVY